MPVVSVESLRPSAPDAIDRLLAELPAALAVALECAPGDVWVTWAPVEAATSGGERRAYAGHSPVVTVRARAWRSEEQVRRGLAAVAHAVGGALGLPVEDVWVHWLELPPGRVFAGGAFR